MVTELRHYTIYIIYPMCLKAFPTDLSPPSLDTMYVQNPRLPDLLLLSPPVSSSNKPPVDMYIFLFPKSCCVGLFYTRSYISSPLASSAKTCLTSCFLLTSVHVSFLHFLTTNIETLAKTSRSRQEEREREKKKTK